MRDYDPMRLDDVIERYIHGRLTPEETIEFEEKCLDDPEILAELEAHQALGAYLPLAVDRVKQQPAAAPQVAHSSWMLAASITLAVGVAVLAGWLVREYQEVEHLEQLLTAINEPQTNVPSFILSTQRSLDQRLTFSLPDDSNWVWALIEIELPSVEHNSYVVNISTETSSMRIDGLSPTPVDTLRLLLPREKLPKERFVVRVHGRGMPEERPELEFVIDVVE